MFSVYSYDDNNWVLRGRKIITNNKYIVLKNGIDINARLNLIKNSKKVSKNIGN